jgi:hypothetical protein
MAWNKGRSHPLVLSEEKVLVDSAAMTLTASKTGAQTLTHQRQLEVGVGSRLSGL